MREVSASEASRNFAAVLDSAENGETIIVTRTGRRIAAITPASRANGGALREVFTRWHGSSAVDDDFVANVVKAGDATSAELDSNPWHD